MYLIEEEREKQLVRLKLSRWIWTLVVTIWFIGWVAIGIGETLRRVLTGFTVILALLLGWLVGKGQPVVSEAPAPEDVATVTQVNLTNRLKSGELYEKLDAFLKKIQDRINDPSKISLIIKDLQELYSIPTEDQGFQEYADFLQKLYAEIIDDLKTSSKAFVAGSAGMLYADSRLSVKIISQVSDPATDFVRVALEKAIRNLSDPEETGNFFADDVARTFILWLGLEIMKYIAKKMKMWILCHNDDPRYEKVRTVTNDFENLYYSFAVLEESDLENFHPFFSLYITDHITGKKEQILLELVPLQDFVDIAIAYRNHYVPKDPTATLVDGDGESSFPL